MPAKSLEAFTADLQREAQALGILEGLPLEGVQASPVDNYLEMAKASYDGHSYTPGPIEPMNPVPTAAPLYRGLPPQWTFNDPPGKRMIHPWPLIPQPVRDEQEQADRLRQWPGR